MSDLDVRQADAGAQGESYIVSEGYTKHWSVRRDGPTKDWAILNNRFQNVGSTSSIGRKVLSAVYAFKRGLPDLSRSKR